MKERKAIRNLIAIIFTGLVCVSTAMTQDQQVKTTFVHLAQGAPAVLYEPINPGAKAQVAVFVMHSAGDYLTHSACTELSKRGYRVLCANNSNDKNGLFNDGVLDRVLLEVKPGILYLRKYPGVKKIVLWGHSGGATVMAAYENIAENGIKICQDDAKVYKCPNSLAALPPADGVIMGDANWGLPIITLLGMNPAVTNENSMMIDSDLDMFNPKNGFDPNGSHYSEDFIRRFQAGQVKRYNALVKLALDRKALIEAGKGMYSDDEPFIIAGASFNTHTLFGTDTSLFSHTQKAWPLLHADGSLTTEVVHSLRLPESMTPKSQTTYAEALRTTVKGFLSTYAIRVSSDEFSYGKDDSLRGIDWKSSWASPEGNAEGISVPVLTMGMTGSYEHSMDEVFHEHVKSADKTLVYVEGATHGYPTCKKCEKTPGQYGDTVKTIYDYADKWLNQKGRFMEAAE